MGEEVFTHHETYTFLRSAQGETRERSHLIRGARRAPCLNNTDAERYHSVVEKVVAYLEEHCKGAPHQDRESIAAFYRHCSSAHPVLGREDIIAIINQVPTGEVNVYPVRGMGPRPACALRPQRAASPFSA